MFKGRARVRACVGMTVVEKSIYFEPDQVDEIDDVVDDVDNQYSTRSEAVRAAWEEFTGGDA